MASGLVGDVIERHNNYKPPASKRFLGGSSGSAKTGFPVAHHRSTGRSVFQKARQDERAQSGLSESRKQLAGISSWGATPEDSNASLKTPRSASSTDDLAEISRMNEDVIANMSADERARETQDIFDKFGFGISDLMAKVREARERRAVNASLDVPDVSNVYTSSVSAPSSTPPSRRTRKIRFAEPTDADVHVYESQPSSPKRALALLPPPDPQERGSISSLGNFKGTLKAPESSRPSTSYSAHRDSESFEEGTPEDIRRRFFPNEPPPEDNPALAWMLPSSSPHVESPPSDRIKPLQTGSHAGSVQEPRYSLSGARLSSTEISDLPTHLGLHHHATSTPSSNVPAGYTLSDLLLLSRSSVHAQRASVLGVLAKILRNAREQNTQSLSSRNDSQEGKQVAVEPSLDVDLDKVRRDMLDSAMDALGEKGGVGQRGVELLWEAIVGFVQLDYGVVDLKDLACVDLTPKKSLVRSSASSDPTSSSIFNTRRSGLDMVMSLPLKVILPMLRQHLVASPSPLSRTHMQVLEILLVLSHFATHARVIVHSAPGQEVVAAMLEPHIRISFGSDDVESEDAHASPTSIHILQALARSSRKNAVKLTGPADLLLRYVTEPRPFLGPGQSHSVGSQSFRLSMALLEETFRFYGILLQYGLYSQVATLARDHIAHIGAWILDSLRAVLDPASASLLCAYVSLLEGLIVCATDPHQTMPSHDILWSQVRGWDWGAYIMEVAESLGTVPEKSSQPYAPKDSTIQRVWASVLHTAAAWIEGASVNGVKGGEAERTTALDRLRPLFETGGGAWKVVIRAMETLRAQQKTGPLDFPGLRDLAQAGDLLGATTRLATACAQPVPIVKPFHFPAEEIQTLCIRFATLISSQGPIAFVLDCHHSELLSESAHLSMKPLCSFMVSQLKFWRPSISTAAGAATDIFAGKLVWTTQALRVLRTLLPGDEDLAQWLIESICEMVVPDFVMPSTDTPPELWEKGGMKLLLPFLVSSLRPAPSTVEEDENQFDYIASTSPTPRSIYRCTTLNVPSLSRMQACFDSGDLDAVLPLGGYWPMLPLNHLLRSGTSPVFDTLPSSWDASETDIVRASLLLARLVQEVGFRGGDNIYTGMSQAIFACMKVFMLEHGQPQADSSEEVFRDTFVTRWMEDLLKPFTYSQSQDAPVIWRVSHPPAPLEQVSKTFLTPGTPFYQFYTDFLALYDAISFSHPLFARLLLPPVSMCYPVDYRKLLFGDFGHVLRTVKTDVPDVLCRDVREYLWPVECDSRVVGWYLKLLLTSPVEGFVRWIAIHHVAANIWPEFTSKQSMVREKAGSLLSVLWQQGKDDVVMEVALYRQREDEVWAPPNCFMFGEIAWRMARLEWVRDVGGEEAKTRFQSLFLGP